MFETALTVPTTHLRELTRRLAAAGFTILDTGERIATDQGPDAEATLQIAYIGNELENGFSLGVSA